MGGRWRAAAWTFVAAWAAAAGTAAALGQTSQPAAGEFDACGRLVQGAECVLFEGGGGTYYVVGDFSRFRVGDAVRIIGELNPDCVSFCQEGDGCIGNAELFDPALFPCGTPVRTPFDPCAGLSTTMLAAGLLGLAWAAGRGRCGRVPRAGGG